MKTFFRLSIVLLFSTYFHFVLADYSGTGATLLKTLELTAIADLEREIMVPMRDGVRLSTHVLKPQNIKTNKTYPVVLIRTPYDLGMELTGLKYTPRLIKRFIEKDYIIVIQNERGAQWSEGKFHFLSEARNDGYDTLDWIVAQPWSNGNVGTLGCSSSAENQMALSAANHPAHKAMIANSSTAGIGTFGGFPSQGMFYKGGVPYLGVWVGWHYSAGAHYKPKLPASITQAERVRLVDSMSVQPTLNYESIKAAQQTLPSQKIMSTLGAPSTDFDTFIQLAPADPEWHQVSFLHAGDQPKVPALHMGSWYDVDPYATVKMFEHYAGVPNQFLIMGASDHCQVLNATEHTQVGNRDVGDGRLNQRDGAYQKLFFDWFDYWLKGKNNRVLDMPRVQTVVMGSGEWKQADQWPLKDATVVPYYLNSGGSANSKSGDGVLALKASDSPHGYDKFLSDPATPVPSVGGFPHGVMDQAEVEVRNDVLVYTSAPLEKGLTVAGDIKLTLYVSTDVKDTDLAVKIVDVYPTGEAFNLTDTMLRLRYRDGYDVPTLLEPNKIYKVAVEGLITSNYFPVGHKIRLHIAGSNFPDFERNMNTGGRNFDEDKPITANIKVHHSQLMPSMLELPVHR